MRRRRWPDVARVRAFGAILALGLAYGLLSPFHAAADPAPPVSGTAGGSQQAASPGPSGPAASPARVNLDSARKTAQAALDAPTFASTLASLSAALTPSDALLLLGEFAPSVRDPAASKALLERAGQLAMLLGDFASAADFLETAALKLPGGRDDVLLLRSARCRLAAGDAEKAADRAALVLRVASDPDVMLSARLVSAWAALFRGDAAGARSSAMALVYGTGGPLGPASAPLGAALGPAPAGSAPRREALFLLWAASPSAERTTVADLLSKEYPGSAETAIIGGAGGGASVSVELSPLPHWYLTGLLGGEAATAPQPAAPLPAPAPPPSLAAGSATAASGTGAGSASPKGGTAANQRRYQVGIFADSQNASLLVAELTKKGFAPKVENRKVGDRTLYAVIVEGEAQSMLLRLKDAGYDPYPLF